MPISWPHRHVTSAVNSAIDCNQPISTYHNQLVKPVPSHKVCTPVFATQHALAGVPPQHALFLGVAIRRI